MAKPHVLVIPIPAQGHVIPLLELAQCLASHNFTVTFVNTDFNHKRVVSALKTEDHVRDKINLVSIPDGLESWEDRNDLAKLLPAILRVMPGKLEELVKEINRTHEQKITCIVADLSMGWALNVAKKMEMKRAAFWPASAALLALGFSIPKLIQDEVIGFDGRITENKMIQLSPSMPAMSTKDLTWACFEDMTTQKIVFEHLARYNKDAEIAEWLLCNSAYAFEPDAFSLHPNILPVGPLLASSRLGNSAGSFWLEDSTCLNWLDQQPTNSVIYVAFGSFTVFNQTQFQELALGLELTNRPFLWVVRPDITDQTLDAYPKGFRERVGARGRIVSWAPQQKVLSHPSVACFLSHCGWNSTIEGVSNGLPFLCWPYFGDQLLNETYICDIWKVGMRFNHDENGIIAKEEIEDKVEKLLNDKCFKERVSNMKKTTVESIGDHGSSSENLRKFIEWVQTP